jgi:hypothetical protein
MNKPEVQLHMRFACCPKMVIAKMMNLPLTHTKECRRRKVLAAGKKLFQSNLFTP